MDLINFDKELSVHDVLKAKLKHLPTYEKLKGLDLKLNSKLDGENKQTKMIKYILLIPLFIYCETTIKNDSIFQRHKNTILHMKDASNFHSFNKRK